MHTVGDGIFSSMVSSNKRGGGGGGGLLKVSQARFGCQFEFGRPNKKKKKMNAKSVMFCGTHRLGRQSSGNSKARPVIARFTCRADKGLTWR